MLSSEEQERTEDIEPTYYSADCFMHLNLKSARLIAVCKRTFSNNAKPTTLVVVAHLIVAIDTPSWQVPPAVFTAGVFSYIMTL